MAAVQDRVRSLASGTERTIHLLGGALKDFLEGLRGEGGSAKEGNLDAGKHYRDTEGTIRIPGKL